jgi:hypothetical protein
MILGSAYAELYAVTWRILAQPLAQALCAAYVVWLAGRLIAHGLMGGPSPLSAEPSATEGQSQP